MNSTKHTFQHEFLDGNVCTLSLNFDDEPKAYCSWKFEPDFAAIEEEYILWRELVWTQYLNLLSPEKMLEVAIKAMAPR